jgi:hypothetical protein
MQGMEHPQANQDQSSQKENLETGAATLLPSHLTLDAQFSAAAQQSNQAFFHNSFSPFAMSERHAPPHRMERRSAQDGRHDTQQALRRKRTDTRPKRRASSQELKSQKLPARTLELGQSCQIRQRGLGFARNRLNLLSTRDGRKGLTRIARINAIRRTEGRARGSKSRLDHVKTSLSEQQ